MTKVTYDVIGKTYDTTRKPDGEIVASLKELLALKLNGRCLDIGCGSGNYTGTLAQQDLEIEGIDLSDEMLKKARKKYPNIIFHQGDAKALAFKNNSYDGATCILATHHIGDNGQLFKEAFRIIREGRFVTFTATREQMRGYWLCHYFPIMMENAINKMASFEELQLDLEQAGFNNIRKLPFFVTNQLQDLFLQSGKYRPEIYLDPMVRQGISSFHLSVDPEELKLGLNQLKSDIKTGKIQEVIENYENDLGDYLFLVAEK